MKSPIKKVAKNRATEFSRDLVRFLDEQHSFNTKNHLVWQRNGMSKVEDVGTVDVVGCTKGKFQILIEAELLREDPASNVTKIWSWAVENGNSKLKILMVQAFSKAYIGRKLRAKKLAKFIGKKLNEAETGVTYVPWDMDYNPRPGGKVGAGRRTFHARELGKAVIKIFSEFK